LTIQEGLPLENQGVLSDQMKSWKQQEEAAGPGLLNPSNNLNYMVQTGKFFMIPEARYAQP